VADRIEHTVVNCCGCGLGGVGLEQWHGRGDVAIHDAAQEIVANCVRPGLMRRVMVGAISCL
jgi:hypothetical protein